MIREERVIVIDVDGTLCSTKKDGQQYGDVAPNRAVIAQLCAYKERGFHIIIATSRNMRTHQGNIGKICAETLPVLLAWLDQHGVPYDEVHVGKPWQGRGGFYVDDKAIRPDEFVGKSYEEILALVGERDAVWSS